MLVNAVTSLLRGAKARSFCHHDSCKPLLFHLDAKIFDQKCEMPATCSIALVMAVPPPRPADDSRYRTPSGPTSNSAADSYAYPWLDSRYLVEASLIALRRAPPSHSQRWARHCVLRSTGIGLGATGEITKIASTRGAILRILAEIIGSPAGNVIAEG